MPASQASLADDAARRTAITLHDRTYLVEAGAGSGKTAVLAGRIVMLLAAGIAPKHIAAVTFTELAASELLIRVRQFTDRLLARDTPRELRVALPQGLAPRQREHLKASSEALDALTCATIHGFCQDLIKPYPVAVNMDPGAAIMDRDQADMMFHEVVDVWLKDNLDQAHRSLLGAMVWQNRDETLKLIRTILEHLRAYPGLRVAEPTDQTPLAAEFIKAAEGFSMFVGSLAVDEPGTQALAAAIAELAQRTRDSLPSQDLADLLKYLLIEQDKVLFTKEGTFRAYQFKGKWERAAAASGYSKTEGASWFNSAKARYDDCRAAWAGLHQCVASHLLQAVLSEVRPALDAYRAHKRATAQLDFDDLIHAACKLLRNHEDIRQALGKRYSHLLVDEFQDTDPMQTEIFWRLCGDPPQGSHTQDWACFRIRPGALFLVGDPKQAIYRFRGADVTAYVRARDALLAQDADALLHITTNFRSRKPILDFVNARFEQPFAEQNGQPGFTALDAFHPAPEGRGCVARLAVEVEANAQGKIPAQLRRDAEAKVVAELCARLIGSEMVTDAKGVARPCRPGDIALLAPTGTELWRYEEALERLAIPVATQAGKGFYRRQEIHDLIALTRVLADRRDTLALGALLRGPLVGLTEEELLDLVAALARKERETEQTDKHDERLPGLHLDMDLDVIEQGYARDTLEKLQSLSRQANRTTPHHVLSQAIDLLRVRPVLVQRHQGQSERVLANLDRFLSLSRAYSVRGLRVFSATMTAAWSDEERAPEGRPDAQEESVALFTVHAAKGLEWPIVVPVNTMTDVRSVASDITDRDAGYLYCKTFGAMPQGYEAVKEAEQRAQDDERLRLWYVATTRAQELLVLPDILVESSTKAWNRVLDLQIGALPSLDVQGFSKEMPKLVREAANEQTRQVFAHQARVIEQATQQIRWRSPSRGEGASEEAVREQAVFADGDAGPSEAQAQSSVRGGHRRGSIIHKLFEELLTGETSEAELVERARELICQTGAAVVDDPSKGLAPRELAECVMRGLALPEIAALRARLVPEFGVFGSRSVEDGEAAVAGVVDAIVFADDGVPEVVIDWKTDAARQENNHPHYRQQMKTYLELTGAGRGLIVFVTRGEVMVIPNE